MKVKTEMKNTTLKVVLTEKREIKINGKPMDNCSYQEIKSEAAKYGQVIGKNIPELKAQIVKGSKGGGAAGDNEKKGVIVKEKFEDKKAIKESESTENQMPERQNIMTLKCSARKKIYMAHTQLKASKDQLILMFGKHKASEINIVLNVCAKQERFVKDATKLLGA